jgi:hypothetical protein
MEFCSGVGDIAAPIHGEERLKVGKFDTNQNTDRYLMNLLFSFALDISTMNA